MSQIQQPKSMYDMSPNDYIPKPCSENWNKMSGDERRRYCDKCSTTVHDLTDKSCDEIATLKKSNGGKLCGAFDMNRFRKPMILGAGIGSLALSACNSNEKMKAVVGECVDVPQPKQTAGDHPEPVLPIHPQILGKICLPPTPPPE